MGRIIVIEGTDGSGKHTQAVKLYEYLQTQNIPVKLQSFPNYESMSAGPVKMYLSGELSNTANEVNARQASALFAVDRLCTMIRYKEFLSNGGTLILDRYVESNMIHQTGKLNSEAEKLSFIAWLANLEYKDLGLPRPTTTIFLDMPTEVSMALRKKQNVIKAGVSKDIHEMDSVHLQKAYENGKWLAKKLKWKVIKCLDANGTLKTIEQINEEIIKAYQIKENIDGRSNNCLN